MACLLQCTSSPPALTRLPPRCAQLPRQPVYVGYRRDVVAALANLCYCDADVVQEVVRVGAALDSTCTAERRRNEAPHAAGCSRVWRLCLLTGGVLTVLQQCRGDDGEGICFWLHIFRTCAHLLLNWLRWNLRAAEDTFLREWALLAVRNVCELSSEAQDAIKCVRVLHLCAFVLTS